MELPQHLDQGFCCGGGGGQMWMETDPNTRINQRRLSEALEINADIVTTACPYCLIMFDDAIRSKGLGDQIQVKDIIEVIDEESFS
jgi:Fe-S oxidoreductase